MDVNCGGTSSACYNNQTTPILAPNLPFSALTGGGAKEELYMSTAFGTLASTVLDSSTTIVEKDSSNSTADFMTLSLSSPLNRTLQEQYTSITRTAVGTFASTVLNSTVLPGQYSNSSSDLSSSVANGTSTVLANSTKEEHESMAIEFV